MCQVLVNTGRYYLVMDGPDIKTFNPVVKAFSPALKANNPLLMEKPGGIYNIHKPATVGSIFGYFPRA